ncbi:MAG: Large exoproteins involved in heme utilization or adhesion, partial [Comamonadaceae bacterium]
MVMGSSYVGGLVGTGTANLTIANSYATGNVAGNGFYHGGLVGRNYGTISSSYATGAVNSNDIAGGLVGVNDGTISNSYATGVVNGGIVGGLVGENSGTVNNSYATGRVNGSSYVGGLVGRNSRTVSNSYWDIGSSGQTSSAGGLGLTSAEMQQMSKFAGFDFAGTWIIYEGHTSPLLRSFMKPLTVGNPTKNYDGLTAGNSAFGLPADHIFGTLTYTGSANGAIIPGTYTATGLNGLYSDQQGYAITFVDGALTVNPRPLTVSGITADAKVYDATTAATLNIGTASFSGILPGDTVSITPGAITGAFADKNAGSNKAINLSGVSLSGTNASYYTLNGVLSANITPKPLSSGISVVEKVYDGKTNATLSNNGVPALLAAQAPGTGTTADGKPYTGDAVSFRGSATGTYNDKNVAEATTVYLDGLVLGGAERGNYSIQREVAGTISPKEVTIDLKIVPRVKTYDGTTTVTVDAYQWFNNASEPWANYMAPASFYTNGLVSSVDQFQSATGTGNFNSKDVATANQITLTSIAFNNYDGNAGRMAYGSNYHLIPGPGTTYFNATGVQTGVQTVPKITPKALTASVAASNKVYVGSTVAAPILTITGGLVGTETLSASGTATFNSKDVATANLVTVNSTTLADGSNGGLAGNYSLASGQTAAASITPANITLTGLTASNKTYDGGTTATVTGTAAVTALAGDSVSVSGTASGAFADKNVGTAKAVNISGLSLSGADASNYTIAPLTADIAQLPSVSWTGGSTGNWSDSANWAGGITPNLANVAAVVIPA